ncbi:MAG TPA: YggS family pyridoxal phosphate-dependent enzyme [Streptosporangiaceae bacterium]|nr:YggS family pyridoxal phosphate-dependent enzyme [Streptosporangiaceae bacterium]
MHADRRGELAGNLAEVRARIAAACAAAGRPDDEVTLIAITKTFPAADAALLYELGVGDFGENRDREAAPKILEARELGVRARWHFVGQLQVNKSASVVSYADVVHSVDRPRLVRALGSHAVAAGRPITCLVQVSLDDVGSSASPGDAPEESGRGGARPADVPALAGLIASTDGLVLGGVMAVAPLGSPARPAFARLFRVAEAVRAEHENAMMISAGMSGDLDDAIAEGATHVRVGTALLGGRRPFVR